MKKSIVLLRILMVTLIVASFVSCIREAGYVYEVIVTNSSGYTLELQRYGHRGSAVDIIDTGKECMIFSDSDEGGYDGFGIAHCDKVEDSIVIRFDDAKKIVYIPRPDSLGRDSIYNTTKNIYLHRFFEITKIDTHDDGFTHYKERFYITPDDYENATPINKQEQL